MRSLAAVAVLLTPLIADAGPNGGGGNNGGGRLGELSGGLRGGGGSKGGGGGGTRPPPQPRVETAHTPILVPVPVVVVGAASGTLVTRRHDGGTAKLEAYAGAQKVIDSDGSWTVELGVRDGLFRLGGAITRYYERQPDDSKIRLTIPTLIGGVRVDDSGPRGPMRVYLEGGIANASTSGDPIADSSHTGAVLGVRVEGRLTRHSTLITEAHEMILGIENGIRAHSLRVGLRSGPVQASFRVLDFNVGPALYGPEIGLKF